MIDIIKMANDECKANSEDCKTVFFALSSLSGCGTERERFEFLQHQQP
jgi:hypothetical protein